MWVWPDLLLDSSGVALYLLSMGRYNGDMDEESIDEDDSLPLGVLI